MQGGSTSETLPFRRRAGGRCGSRWRAASQRFLCVVLHPTNMGFGFRASDFGGSGTARVTVYSLSSSGLGIEVFRAFEALGCKLQDFEFRVQGFRVEDVGFRIRGFRPICLCTTMFPGSSSRLSFVDLVHEAN